MAQTRHQKLALRLSEYITQLKESTGKQSEIESKNIFRKQLFQGCLLRCETIEEHRQRKMLTTLNYKQEREHHAIYYEQFQNNDSIFWKNAQMLADPVYHKWLLRSTNLTYNEKREVSYHHPFLPEKNESVVSSLIKIKKFIEHKPSRYYKDLAASYREFLLEALFERTGIKVSVARHLEEEPAYALRIIRELDIDLEPDLLWADQKFLKVLPGRKALSGELTQVYILNLIEAFQSAPTERKLIGETLLTMWLLLACAYHRRRFCSVADIFRIQERDISYDRPRSLSRFNFPTRYFIRIHGENVLISRTLGDMLLMLADQRAPNRPIIQFDRSSVEAVLCDVSLQIDQSLSADPVTPETFLEVPHFFGENVRA
jgi:hypothetical protein